MKSLWFVCLVLSSAAFHSSLSFAQEKLGDLAEKLYQSGKNAQKESKVDDAIKLYEKLIDIEVPRDPVSGEPADLGFSFREQRGAAQWQLGHCYAAKGDFARAAQAYRNSREKYRRLSFCGNCMAQHRCEAIHNEGCSRPEGAT